MPFPTVDELLQLPLRVQSKDYVNVIGHDDKADECSALALEVVQSCGNGLRMLGAA
jgi:hypothetical protein